MSLCPRGRRRRALVQQGAAAMAVVFLALSSAPAARGSTFEPHAPGAPDYRCNHGHGVVLPGPPPSSVASLGVITLKNGVTIVSIQSFSSESGTTTVQLDAIHPNCRLDTAFGSGGTKPLLLPGADLSIFYGMAPTPAGFVVFGADGPQWIARELTPVGAPDRAFAGGGWAHGRPPRGWRGFVAGVMATAGVAGGLYLAADAQPLCCTYDAVAKIEANGKLDDAYGVRGWTHVLRGGFQVTQLIPEPGGRLGIFGEVGQMGCGTTGFATLNRSGAVMSSVASHLNASIRSLRPNDVNEGIAYPDSSGGMGVIGWGHEDCSAIRGWPGQFAFSEDFAPSGALARRTYLVPATFEPTFGAFDVSGRVVAGTFNLSETSLTLREFTASGAPISQFGGRGTVTLRLGGSALGAIPVIATLGDVFEVAELTTSGVRIVALDG